MPSVNTNDGASKRALQDEFKELHNQSFEIITKLFKLGSDGVHKMSVEEKRTLVKTLENVISAHEVLGMRDSLDEEKNETCLPVFVKVLVRIKKFFEAPGEIKPNKASEKKAETRKEFVEWHRMIFEVAQTKATQPKAKEAAEVKVSKPDRKRKYEVLDQLEQTMIAQDKTIMKKDERLAELEQMLLLKDEIITQKELSIVQMGLVLKQQEEEIAKISARLDTSLDQQLASLDRRRPAMPFVKREPTIVKREPI